MPDKAMDQYEVDVQGGERSGSFWHKLAFLRVNLAGDLAAEAVAAGSSGTPPSALPNSRIVIRNSSTGQELWHVNTSDLNGGTSAEQLQENINSDLAALSPSEFATKWGFRQ